MATPPTTPPPNPDGSNGPIPPGDPRNRPYAGGPYPPDPRVLREQARTEREQAKAWNQYQREAAKQQARAARQQARMAAEAQRAQIRAWRASNRAQSLIGPLLLISVAVAVLLVYTGRVSAMGMIGWFGRWWPLVLIGAGVLRLLEWGIARRQSATRGVPVRFAIGGGTVWLLVLLSLTGVAAQGGLHRSGDQWTLGWTGDDLSHLFGAKHEQDAPALTHSIAADGTLAIDNGRGDVTVQGGSDDGLVHVSEHKEVFASNDGRAEGEFSALDPQFTGTDSNLSLRVAANEGSSAALTITVPRGVHIVLNANHGDVSVQSLRAPLVINANRGDVSLDGVAGDVEIRTNSHHGDVEIHNVQGAVQLTGDGGEVNLDGIQGTVGVHGNFFGSGRLQHIAGAVDFQAGRIGFAAQRIDGEVAFDSDDEFSATNIAGPVAVRTRSRNISLSRVSGDVEVTNSSGHVDITAAPPAGTITVNNRDGDVNLSLPSAAKFTLAAETSDGTIHSSFPGTANTPVSSHRGSLTTTVGAGGPAIHLTTTHGNIELARNEQGPVTPMPPVPPVPAIPAVPAMPAEARAAVRSALQEAREAQREGEQAAREGRAEGERARKEAQQEADPARKEALQESRDARREADQQRKEALQQAEQQRREALQKAEETRREADQARREAEQNKH